MLSCAATCLLLILVPPPSPPSTSPAGGLTCFAEERTAYRRTIAALLARERFDELEAKAEALRQHPLRFSSGAPVLFDLYQGLNPRAEPNAPADQGANRERLQRWLRSRPSSLTARVAIMRDLIDEGWEARGEGRAAAVSTEGWRHFEAALARALSIGEEAVARKKLDATLYDSMLTAAQGLQRPRPELEALVEAGTAIDPLYDHLYIVLARHTMPRWGGTPAQFERLASQAAEKTKSKLGDAMYARLAAEGLLLYGGGDFEPLSTAFRWPRLKAAFEDLDRVYPRSILVLHSYAYLAMRFRDLVTARAVMERTGGEWCEDARDIWSREIFVTARTNILRLHPEGN